MQRTIIIATALAAMMGTPALAQRPANDGGPMAPLAPAVTAPAPARTHAQRVQSRRMWRAGEGAYAAVPESTVTTGGLYLNGKYVGWDPDPNIRFQLLRDPNGIGSQ